MNATICGTVDRCSGSASKTLLPPMLLVMGNLKSGSSSLNYYLGLHHLIRSSSVRKELNCLNCHNQGGMHDRSSFACWKHCGVGLDSNTSEVWMDASPEYSQMDPLRLKHALQIAYPTPRKPHVFFLVRDPVQWSVSFFFHLRVDSSIRDESDTYENNASWPIHDQMLHWIKHSRISTEARTWRSISTYCNLFRALRVADRTLGMSYVHTLRTEWMADGVLLPNILKRIASLFDLPVSPMWDQSLVHTVINSRTCRGQDGKRECSTQPRQPRLSWFEMQSNDHQATIKSAVEQSLHCREEIEPLIALYSIFHIR